MKKKNKIKITLKHPYTIITITILLVLTTIILVTYPHIKLKGTNPTKVTYPNSYKEQGVTTPKYQKNLLSKVKIKNNIDETKLGEYQVTYTYPYLIFKLKKTRNVIIIDKTAPQITLQGNAETTVCPAQTYKEEGYTALDNYDGDITSKVKRNEEEDYITYTVKDTSKNKTTIKRKLIYEDKQPPLLALQGPTTIYLKQGTTYKEKGYTASDNCDGDLTNNVKVEGTINTNQEGTNKLTYTVKDKAGNERAIQRTIIVTSNKQESRGVIYLTFDDGPSYTTTPKVLEILKEENIKATFFVIGTSPSFNEYVKREYNEGHTIALHSNTHNYSTVYSSPSAYWADLTQIQNKVNNIIGIKPTIIRFPGGSSNTVSRRYYNGIMTILTKEVTNNGYHYFDWNVLSGDAGDVSSSAEVYNNVTSALSHNRANVVLMHDFENNNYTLGALRDIIKYAKANGYTFDKITENTKEVHHQVNN